MGFGRSLRVKIAENDCIIFIIVEFKPLIRNKRLTNKRLGIEIKD